MHIPAPIEVPLLEEELIDEAVHERVEEHRGRVLVGARPSDELHDVPTCAGACVGMYMCACVRMCMCMCACVHVHVCMCAYACARHLLHRWSRCRADRARSMSLGPIPTCKMHRM